MVMTGSKEGLSPIWTKQRGHVLHILRIRAIPTSHAQRDPLGQKGRGHQAAISLVNLLARLCFGIYYPKDGYADQGRALDLDRCER